MDTSAKTVSIRVVPEQESCDVRFSKQLPSLKDIRRQLGWELLETERKYREAGYTSSVS